MRRFKDYNKNQRIVKQVKKVSKQYGAKGFITLDCYFIYRFSKNSVIHFTLPNNYKVGIWLDNKTVFAEHLDQLDKFKPSAVEFAEVFTTMVDIENFIKKVSNLRNDEYDESYVKEIKEIAELNREGYQYLRNMDGVERLDVIHNPNSILPHKYIIYTSYATDEDVLENIINKFMNTRYTKDYNSIFYRFGWGKDVLYWTLKKKEMKNETLYK